MNHGIGIALLVGGLILLALLGGMWIWRRYGQAIEARGKQLDQAGQNVEEAVSRATAEVKSEIDKLKGGA